MPTLTLRLMRCLGWGVILSSVGVVAGVLLIEIARGPLSDQSLWPTPARWRYLGNTLAMSSAATLLSLLLSLLPAVGLATASSRRCRALLAACAAVPLLTMPSIFAYAWFLLSTIPTGAQHPLAPIGRLLVALGWNRPGAQLWESAWVLATWLWPIPALILATSFRRQGLAAYQLAALDAPPLRAFLQGALPVMRAPLLAALAAVFVLASIDATIPPLMQATDTWAGELLAQAAIATGSPRPVGFLLWQCWPLILVLVGAALLALPGLRTMSRWEAPAREDLGQIVAASNLLWSAGLAVSLCMGTLPLIVFAVELANGRTSAGQSIQTAYATLSTAGLSTLIAASGAAFASICAALALLEDNEESPVIRGARALVAGACLVCAIIPPELTGTALASTYSRISDPLRMNLYDHTPFVWMAALVARFLIIPVFLVRLLNRRVPGDLLASARSDGASMIETAAHVRVPSIWGGLCAGGIIVACLGLSEVAASMIVQPSQFLGGSLAVEIDSQMHYGRQNETIASALMMLTPALLAAGIGAMWMRRR